MRKSRIDISISYDLRAVIEELEGLWYLSSPSFGLGTLHDFVRGLIFSEKMIQIIDGNLPNGYRADWGQIVDEKTGNYLSKECDIIIYKGSPIRNWGKKAIKFVVIENTKAKLVIQCSTNFNLSKEHKVYPKNIKIFGPEIWYLAERYWGARNQFSLIKNELKKAGYAKFFYLYRMYEKKAETYKELNYNGWNEFIRSIRSLK